MLRRPADPVTPDEVTAAALQFVRKVSGFRKPSKANQEAFDAAIAEVAAATSRLLEQVASHAPAIQRTTADAESPAGPRA